jgi:hypothetical protein
VIELLLARGEREMSLGTLAAMARGGIYDQIGGGFARYSVDATWTVPHFEKMLYDNALLARAYLHGWQVSGEERFRRVCCETLDWALREMHGPEGGFCAALDADSEGVEGKFYVWTLDELRDVLGSDLADTALEYFRPRPFEHALILEGRGPEPPPDVLTEIQRRLLATRSSAPTTSRRRSAARRSCSTTCATPMVACCGPGRTAGAGSPRISKTTHSWSRR